jgi:chaperonin cofactor prefoldin
MPTEAESFLETEEAVSKLLENLESLKMEMEAYKTGRIQLEEQLKDLRGFMERIKVLAETSQDVLGALGRIGTPEILERVAGVEAASKKTSADVHAIIELLESKMVGALAKSEASMAEKLQTFQSLLHAGNAEIKSGLWKSVKRLTLVSIITPLVASAIVILVLVFGK